MKNWKKWLAVLLCVAMLMSLLAACGGDSDSENDEDEEETEEKDETKDDKEETKGDDKDETKPDGTKPSGDATQPQPTQPQGTTPQPTEPQPTTPNRPTVNTSDFFDVAATLDEMDAYDELRIQFAEDDGNIRTIAVENISADKALFYYSDAYDRGGYWDNYETVIEVDGETVTDYLRMPGESFVKVDDAEEAMKDLEYIYSLFVKLSVDNGEYGMFGVEYVADGTTNALTGPAYVFKETDGDNVSAEILVDQATGIIVKNTFLIDAPYVFFEVAQIDTTDAGIPAYK